MIQLLLTVFCAELLAQLIKFFTFRFKTGKFDFRMLLTDGGMPSGHSTTVASLATGVYLLEGLSPLFVVVFFLALIVLRDATGVRRAAGRQAHILNQLSGKHHLKGQKLKELIGHTKWEVFWGVILGVIITILSFSLF